MNHGGNSRNLTETHSRKANADVTMIYDLTTTRDLTMIGRVEEEKQDKYKRQKGRSGEIMLSAHHTGGTRCTPSISQARSTIGKKKSAEKAILSQS